LGAPLREKARIREMPVIVIRTPARANNASAIASSLLCSKSEGMYCAKYSDLASKLGKVRMAAVKEPREPRSDKPANREYIVEPFIEPRRNSKVCAYTLILPQKEMTMSVIIDRFNGVFNGT
jgi:hypothetical protein